jgi:hypothetical protein
VFNTTIRISLFKSSRTYICVFNICILLCPVVCLNCTEKKPYFNTKLYYIHRNERQNYLYYISGIYIYIMTTIFHLYHFSIPNTCHIYTAVKLCSLSIMLMSWSHFVGYCIPCIYVRGSYNNLIVIMLHL